MLGFDVDGQSVALRVESGQFEESVVVGVGMHIIYTLEVTPEGTRITHRLTSQLPRGFLGSILSIFLRRRFRKMQRELLERLREQSG